MADLFVRRPVLAMVIAILIVLLGLVSLRDLAIKEYPEVTPPQVQVQATYPGASAQVLEETVAQPLEEAINGVDDLLYMSSTASNNGQLSISVYFETGTNLDTANTLVQNRVSQAQSQLPQDVVRQGVTVKKAQSGILLLVALSAKQGDYDQTFLSNFVTLRVRDQVLRVPGVGDAQMLGLTDYAMRLWLRPDRMAQLGVDASDVLAAVREQNILTPAGSVGAPPQQEPPDFQLTVQAPGRLRTAEEFGNIILRTDEAGGGQVRVRDVARTEIGALTYDVITRMNGNPVGLLAVYQAPGADALQTAQGVRAALDALRPSFPPGVDYTVSYDTTPPITASIEEIVVTLFEALVLVVLVVFVFLQNWRATLIPILTVPVSLIGTFIFFPMLGFSINVLTMFGLVLAIGIVVDDAIVVTEAVMHHMEEGMDRRAATIQAMREVSGPVIAIALILSAVFLPVAFMGGITGQLYRQFALTIAIAVLLSALSALTLSPALCSLLLKPAATRGWVHRAASVFNRGFERTTRGYLRVSHLFIRRSILGLAVLAFVALGTGGLLRVLPTSFLPPEDKGVFIVNVQLPDASSLARTDAVMMQVVKLLQTLPEARTVTSVTGFGILQGGAAPDGGTLFVSLRPWSERPGADQSMEAILRRVNGLLFQVEGATAFAFSVPPITGLSIAGGFSFELQDRGGNTPEALDQALQAFLAAARQRPELTNPFSTYSAGVPQLSVTVDRDQARQRGVPISSVYETLQTFLGGAYVNDFTLFGRVFQVYAQAEGRYRRNAGDINEFFVRNASDEMVPLSTLVRIGQASGPNSLRHFNLYRAAQVTGQPSPGFSSGQALAALSETAARVLPPDFGYEWSGESFEEVRNVGQEGMAYGLAVVFVFLLLAALYESWSLPFSVLLGTPFAMAGALFGTWLMGLTNNVYTQIGIVLLIGLAAKNAILIVEFAKMRRESEGLSPDDAAMEGARLRFRPILMTSFAFIFGTLPLVFATGSGANSRMALGTTVVFGMTAATLLGIFLIPMLYAVIARIGARRSSGQRGAALPESP